jgi:hypothetical protein
VELEGKGALDTLICCERKKCSFTAGTTEVVLQNRAIMMIKGKMGIPLLVFLLPWVNLLVLLN